MGPREAASGVARIDLLYQLAQGHPDQRRAVCRHEPAWFTLGGYGSFGRLSPQGWCAPVSARRKSPPASHRRAEQQRQRWPKSRPVRFRICFEKSSKAVESSDMTEYFRWWVVDQSTGERRLTDKRISREDAQRRFPGAVPDLRTREFREEELFADTLPPD